MTNDEKRHHAKVKLALKITGITLAIIGLIFTIIGISDFFASMNSDDMDMPDKFWCAFVGLPLMMIGVAISVFGFKRELATYVKNEAVPVINETGKELKPAITSVAEAVKDVIEDNDGITCTCGTINEAGSKYCRSCGAELMMKCPHCGKDIPSDSAFCNHCGKKID